MKKNALHEIIPDYSIKVDILNPGHFYAACGLLELESVNNPNAIGWFDIDKGLFSIYNHKIGGERLQFRTLLENLNTSKIVKLESDEIIRKRDNDPPLFIEDNYNVELNWWKENVNPDFKYSKTWAGNQNAYALLTTLKSHLAKLLDTNKANKENILDEEVEQKTSTYIDARMRLQEDMGTGAITYPTQKNKLIKPLRIFPIVEILCFFGFQKFRPRPTVNTPRTLLYSAWTIPLTLSVASIISSEIYEGSKYVRNFEFLSIGRSGGKYKSYTYGREI